MNGYDIIGDVHGHADKLRNLLTKLGYSLKRRTYRHAERRVIFVGDLIDRGPKIREALEIVRAMVDGGQGLAVMGNHELNAIHFHSRDDAGHPLRPHDPEKIRQHAATLEQLANPSPAEWLDWLDWFKSLPFFLEVGGLRVVHACWNNSAIEAVTGRSLHDRAFLLATATKGTVEFAALEILLKGPELELPAGDSWRDKDGHERTAMRTQWFFKPQAGRAYSYRELAFPPLVCFPSGRVGPAHLREFAGYPPEDPPVLFGHYWLPPGIPERLAPNVACLDYSAGKGGPLVAYRWDGEEVLDAERFVVVTSTI